MSLTTIAPVLTSAGVVAPTYYEVVEFLKNEYRAIYGPDAYIENDSQDGQWIGVLARVVSDCGAACVDAVSTFSPKTATKESLSRNVAINGIIQVTVLPYYMWLRSTYRFGEGVAAGNISEVGLGWANANLWNRALVKDTNGNPTTITVLADEYLDVIAEIRVYPQETLSGSFNFLNKAGAIVSTHTYIGRAWYYAPQNNYGQMQISSVGVYSGAMGSSPTAQPSGTRLDYGSPTTTVYPTPTSIKCTKIFPIANAIGEHRTLFVQHRLLSAGSGSGYQVEFTPTITKTNQMELTYTVSMSWGRYTGA